MANLQVFSSKKRTKLDTLCKWWYNINLNYLDTGYNMYHYRRNYVSYKHSCSWNES